MNPVKGLQSLVFLLLSGVASHQAQAVDFKQLVNHPERYGGKRVSIVGVAAVDGPHFVLYQPPRGTSISEFAREVLVSPRISGPRYLDLNNHWVRVTGVVRPRERQTDYYGCIIDLENVEKLSGPPVTEPRTLVLFFNAGPTPVGLKLYAPNGGLAGELELGVQGLEQSKIEKETEAGTVKVFDLSGKLLSSAPLSPTPRTPQNFDIALGTYYYQIIDGKINLVPPQDATTLKKRWKEVEEQTEREAR